VTMTRARPTTRPSRRRRRERLSRARPSRDVAVAAHLQGAEHRDVDVPARSSRSSTRCRVGAPEGRHRSFAASMRSRRRHPRRGEGPRPAIRSRVDLNLAPASGPRDQVGCRLRGHDLTDRNSARRARGDELPRVPPWSGALQSSDVQLGVVTIDSAPGLRRAESRLLRRP